MLVSSNYFTLALLWAPHWKCIFLRKPSASSLMQSKPAFNGFLHYALYHVMSCTVCQGSPNSWALTEPRHLSVPHILRNNFETFLLFPRAENDDFIAHWSGLKLSWLLREIQMCLFASKLQVSKAQAGNVQGKLKCKKTNVPCLHAVKLQLGCIWRSSRHERMVGLGPGVQHMLQVCMQHSM